VARTPAVTNRTAIVTRATTQAWSSRGMTATLPDVQRQRSSAFAVAEKMRLALVPPKPKEFVITCVIGMGKA
jgi:hypothetical protein